MIQFLQFAGLLISFVCCLLLSLKLVEMVKSVEWAVTTDESVVERLHRALIKGSSEKFSEILRQSNFPFFPGSFIFSRWLMADYKSKLVRDFVRLVRDFAFRYPILMIALSILIALILAGRDDGGLGGLVRVWSIVLASLIFVGVWVKVLHLLVYRFRFGVADNYLLSMSVPVMRSDVTEVLNRRLALQRFLVLILSSLLTFLFAYSAIYLVFAKQLVKGQGLKGMSDDVPFLIQTFYFSTATCLTVGFGDISPTGLLAILTVTTEMLLSLLLLIIFVTAFAATVPSGD